jgi:hypothetical protein
MEGATLIVKVVPGASRDAIAGRHGAGIKVRVTAPPERGKANAAVVRVLASALGLKPQQIRVLRGHAAPSKLIGIDGISSVELSRKLAALT